MREPPLHQFGDDIGPAGAPGRVKDQPQPDAGDNPAEEAGHQPFPFIIREVERGEDIVVDDGEGGDRKEGLEDKLFPEENKPQNQERRIDQRTGDTDGEPGYIVDQQRDAADAPGCSIARLDKVVEPDGVNRRPHQDNQRIPQHFQRVAFCFHTAKPPFGTNYSSSSACSPSQITEKSTSIRAFSPFR